jgi:hypothetical protein
MTITRTSPARLLVRHEDDSSVLPVSAGTDPVEVHIAAEMTATLHVWLHRLPAQSAYRRPTGALYGGSKMGTTFFGPGGPTRASGQIQGDYTPPSEKDLLVQPLSGSQWRVSDRRYPEYDASSLLGFIEQKDDTFELTQLERGFQWFYFPSLAEAIAHFTQTPPTDSLAESESESESESELESELSWSPSNV